MSADLSFWVLALILGLTGGYASCVVLVVIRADFYSTPQKIAQCAIALLVPLFGAALVHWFLLAHKAKPDKPDRAFIPEERPNIDDLRGLH